MGWFTFGQDKKRDKDVVDMFRRIFDTDIGRKVLAFMLAELGFFDTAADKDLGEHAKQDYAKRLLRLCGIFNVANVQEVVDTFMEIKMKSGAEGSGV